MTDILEKMKEKCSKAGYYPTANIEKIARAKNMMFVCISPLCQSDIERDGICHCRCYQKAKPE